MVVKTRKEAIRSKKNSEIGVGSVIGDFVLISYDEDDDEAIDGRAGIGYDIVMRKTK